MVTVDRLVNSEQQMTCPGPGPALGPNPLLGFTFTLCSSDVSDRQDHGSATMQKMNSWSFCKLNNIPDGAPVCADLVLQTT